MRKRSLFVVGILAAVTVAVSLGFFWPFGRNGKELILPGTVEVQELRLGSKVGGRVASVSVKEGEEVPEDQELVRFDAPELEAQKVQLVQKLAAARAERDKVHAGPRPQEKDEARAAMEAAKARRDRMEKGWRKEEKDQAEADLSGAKADLELARKNFERIEKLNFQVSPTEYDTAVGRLKTAEERFNSALARKRMIVDAGQREEDKREAEAEYQRALAKHSLAQEGSRQEDKDQADAQVKELEGKLREIEVNLNETTVRAPCKIIVEVLSVRKGDLVTAFQPVIRALQYDDRWVKVFVPSTDLGKINRGDAVEVTCDSYPGKKFKGTIIQIGTIGEFTPRNVQSLDERRHQVFAVKVRVDDGGDVFKSGMAAEVSVRLK
jgi:HlyD family secretion protein